MKVTSEQLLELFGLKVGDKIRVYDNSYNLNEILDMELVVHDARLQLKNMDKIYGAQYFELTWLLDFKYEIIKPTPKLSDDEKEIFKALSKIAVRVVIQHGRFMFLDKDYDDFALIDISEERKCMFNEFKEYDIKELLDV